MVTATKRADFEAVFPSLVAEWLSHTTKYNLPEKNVEWFRNVGFHSIAIVDFPFIS